MAELKTKPTDESVEAFLAGVANDGKRQDCFTILQLMQQATGAEPKMWGSIIGFGDLRYKYESGREGDWFLTGFSPRKQNLTLYLAGGLDSAILNRLGKYSIGKSCLYIKKLEDVDLPTLKELLQASVEQARLNEPKS